MTIDIKQPIEQTTNLEQDFPQQFHNPDEQIDHSSSAQNPEPFLSLLLLGITIHWANQNLITPVCNLLSNNYLSHSNDYNVVSGSHNETQSPDGL